MTRGKPDFLLLFTVFLLVGFGLVMVFSSSYYIAMTETDDSYFYFKRQLAAAVLGLFALFFAMNVKFTLYRKLMAPMLVVTVVLLIAVFFMEERGGAHRWIILPGFQFQPSELAKITAVVYAAYIFSKKQDRLDSFWRGLFPPLTIIGGLFLLIVLEPHFSSAFMLFVSCMAVVFCSKARLRHLFLLAVLSVPVLIGFLLLRGYRLTRLETYLDPFADKMGSGFQTVQSLYAIAPGGWSGVGLGNSIQKMLYLPEAHTDFIFSIIAEELGFIGSSGLIFLYLLFIWRGIVIALRSPNQFGFLLAIGLVTLIGIQAFLNIAVATALIPVTGVPLPFISYGGTSLLMCMAISGILLNISRYKVPRKQRKKGDATREAIMTN